MDNPLQELQEALWAVDLVAEKIKREYPEAYTAIYQSQDQLRGRLYELKLFRLVAEISPKAEND